MWHFFDEAGDEALSKLLLQEFLKGFWMVPRGFKMVGGISWGLLGGC